MDLGENSKEIQADLPEINDDETQLKLRPLERVKLYPKAPIEPSSYGKGKNFSRPWILQDGRKVSKEGSEMRDSFKIPKKSNYGTGIRKRMLTNFFWEQMLDEVIEDLATSQTTSEFCTEYDTHYVKDQFEPRSLEVTADKNMHLKYPLYGTGSSAVTFTAKPLRRPGLERFWKNSEDANILQSLWRKDWTMAGFYKTLT